MKVSLLVMGTTSHNDADKYRLQTLGCCETWVKDTHRTTFICGDHFDPVFEAEAVKLSNNKAEFIHIPGIGEDYQSASYKQWMGLGWLMQNRPSDWYGILGTDNYVFYERLKTKLAKYPLNHPFAIGGHGETRFLDCLHYFYLGGAGIFVNHECLRRIWGQSKDYITIGKRMCDDWVSLCGMMRNDFAPACDLALCYALNKLDIPKIAEPNLFPCNYFGKWVYGGFFKPIVSEIVVCHYMDRTMMRELHLIRNEHPLISNGYATAKFNAPVNEERLSTLLFLAKECKSIVEIGCDYRLTSSEMWSFLGGLEADSTLIGIPLSGTDYPENFDDFLELSDLKKVDYSFDLDSDAVYPSVDMLFVGNWPREFDFDRIKVSKYIVFGKKELKDLADAFPASEWTQSIKGDLIILTALPKCNGSSNELLCQD